MVLQTSLARALWHRGQGQETTTPAGAVLRFDDDLVRRVADEMATPRPLIGVDLLAEHGIPRDEGLRLVVDYISQKRPELATLDMLIAADSGDDAVVRSWLPRDCDMQAASYRAGLSIVLTPEMGGTKRTRYAGEKKIMTYVDFGDIAGLHAAEPRLGLIELADLERIEARSFNAARIPNYLWHSAAFRDLFAETARLTGTTLMIGDGLPYERQRVRFGKTRRKKLNEKPYVYPIEPAEPADSTDGTAPLDSK